MTEVLRAWTFAVLWALTLTVPWEAALQVPAIGTVSRAVGLLAVPLAAAALLVGGRRRRLLDAHLFMIGLGGWALASAAWSIRSSVSIQMAGTLIQLVAMVLLLWEFGGEPARHRQLMWAFVLGALVGAVAIFRAAATQDILPAGDVRFTEGGLNENHAAFVFSMAIPVAWHLCLTSLKAIHRFVAGLAVAAGTVAAILTGSRGGLLTLIVALAILPLTLRGGGMRLRIMAFIALAAAIVLAASLVPPETIERLETIPSEVASGDLGSRGTLWELSVGVFATRPVTGVGAGASRFLIAPLFGREQAPHNTYLSLAADLGIVGIGLFLLVLLSIAGRLVRLSSGERLLGGVLLSALLVGLLPGHREYVKITWLVIALVLAESARLPARVAGRLERSQESLQAVGVAHRA